ncbi:MAG: hypothetical protein K0S76_1128 [Herbinix sp.]|jgi:poly-gamma-glutamate synthesis protein (capsule biosynthesis protein)|nr:hypothetical protein [Herbinix sp.]
MKKRNFILLSIVCILSLILLGALIAFAFEIQKQKDKQNNESSQNSDFTPDEDPLEADLNSGNSADDNTGSEDPTEQETPSTDNQNPAEGENTEEDDITDLGDSTSNTELDGTETPDSDETDAAQPDGSTSDEDSQNSQTGNEMQGPIVLGFAGDVNFNEESKPVARYDRENKGILGGLSKDLVEEMKAVDIMMLNNEFAYSTRGTKLPDKSYTFRANPKRVDILHEMGVDIVSLANNHALDYGQDALLDTFTTLDEAGIEYVGAGENLDRAKAPIYYTLGDTKIAYVAASRVIYAMDWYATDTRPGMIGTYDPTLLIESIREASANSDYVAVFVHWGVEKNNYPEDYQRKFAKQYIDAGADIVIGCHPHVMQGIEIYKGKPIAYSLGNYWFNSSTQYSGLVKLYIEDGALRTQLLPVMADNMYSYILKEESERKDYYEYLEEISFGVSIDKDGFITEKQE